MVFGVSHRVVQGGTSKAAATGTQQELQNNQGIVDRVVPMTEDSTKGILKIVEP